MKRVYSSLIRSTCEYVKNILEEQGIPCIITGDYLGVAVGEIPPIETWPGVWVLQNADEDRALQIIEDLNQKEKEKGTWRCARCGEELDQQFDMCWKCGTARPG